jgi:hypothetical protein
LTRYHLTILAGDAEQLAGSNAALQNSALVRHFDDSIGRSTSCSQ